MTDPDNRITTLEPHEKPTAQQLINELLEAIIAASGMDMFTRLVRCHNTRECLWDAKAHDGRISKDQANKQVWRWTGAPDMSVPICDKIVRWLMMIRAGVMNRGDVRIAPRRVPKADGDGSPQDLAEVWQNAMEYFLYEQDFNLSSATELFSTCVEEFGYGIIMAEWVKKFRMELRTMTVQQLTDALVKRQQDELMLQMQDAMPGQEIDPNQVLTPEVMQGIVQRVEMDLDTLLSRAEPVQDWHHDLIRAVDERIEDAEARRVLAALRKDPAEPAEYTAPRDDGGTFECEVLIPWVNCIHPQTMSGEGKTDMIAVVRYYTESELLEKARSEKWDKAATAELRDNQQNKFFSQLAQTTSVQIPGWALNGMGIGLEINENALKTMPHWLVVYVYRKVVNKAGMPMVYKAALNPNMPDHLLMWQKTDLVNLPIVVDTATPVRYAMLAKGAAEVIVDKQNFVKDGMDNEGSRAQMGSNPPLLRTSSQHVGITPGKELYVKRSSASADNDRFMEVPGVDVGALKLMEKAELLVDQYYFRSADTAPEDKRRFEEWKIMRSIRCHRELLRLIWCLMQEGIDDLQVSMINGRPVKLATNRDQLKGEADITIAAHLDGYSEEAAEKFVKVLTQLMQADRGGTIDATEGVQIAAQLLAPTYARRLVMKKDVAAQKIVDEQQMRIAKIMAGVPLEYPEDVTAPEMRLQVVQQWQGIPENMAAMRARTVAAALMQKEIDWLMFQNQQQNVNAVTGRTGVEASTAEELGAA